MIPKESSKTGEALEKRLRKAASKPMTKDEVREQRISFVYGNLPHNSTLTREEVARILASREGV